MWYFDATGKIIRNVGNTCTYLYSIVMHDDVNRKIIPAAEFCTNSHNVSNISKYLLVIKREMNVAPFIVVDESWALINSIMNTFNGCSALAYINWTWDVIHNQFVFNVDLHLTIKTRLFLCHTHFFKNIIRKTNKVIKDKRPKNSRLIKTVFQYTFTLLQNSVTLDEFTGYLELCFIIFSSVTCPEDSIHQVNTLIDKRNLKILSEIHDPQILNLETEKNKENSDYYGTYLDNSDGLSIVEKSSYTKYFKDKIEKFESK